MNTSRTKEWRREWAGDSPYADPIVHDAVELMEKMESELNQLRRAATEYIAEMDDYSRRSEKLRSIIADTSYEPNNRPQDGRVCDCEDAPCCGHYEL